MNTLSSKLFSTLALFAYILSISSIQAAIPPKGIELFSFNVQNGITEGLAFSENGNLFVGTSSTIEVYDPCGNFLYDFNPDTGGVKSVTVDKNGNMIFLQDNAIYVNKPGGQKLFQFNVFANPPDPDYTGIATGKCGFIYVLGTPDRNNQPFRVSVFGPCGNFLFQFGEDSLPSKQVEGIAVNSDGQVFVTDIEAVFVFGPQGNLLFKINEAQNSKGIAVTEAGEILVVSGSDGDKVKVYDRCGNFIKEFDTDDSSSSIAVSNKGIVAVGNDQTQQIKIFE